ncbi:MAG TPA: ROK family protein [Acidimicrobiales bacterium]|nr:ROK family protein [Acidimicrobiales bacterium]
MSGRSVGVDVGGTKIEAVLVEHDGAVVATARRATPRAADAPGVVVADTIAAAIGDLAAAAGGADLAAGPVGVGVPGMLSLEGTIVFSPNLPSTSGVDLRAVLSVRNGLHHVTLVNDADAAAVAEHRLGAARGVDDFVLVTLGTGIGGGLVVGGRLVRGSNGFAGEIGHVVVDPSGPRCPCGKRGCWERYASGAGVARLSREAAVGGRLGSVVSLVGDAEAVRGEDVTHAAAAGDREALAVLDEVGWWLALGIANLAAVLDPSCVVLGGGLVEASSLLLPPTRRHLVGLLEAGEVRPALDVRAAALGPRAGAIGAALLARDG